MPAFNAYILSNGCLQEFPGNNPASFSVAFPVSFDVQTCERAKWCLAINSIGISINFDDARLTQDKPKLLKLKCFNVRNQMLANTHTNDVEIFECFTQSNDYYFHEFEKTVFIPLLASNLSHLKFMITDKDDNVITINSQHPTVLSVSFKKCVLIISRSMSDYSRHPNIAVTPGATLKLP